MRDAVVTRTTVAPALPAPERYHEPTVTNTLVIDGLEGHLARVEWDARCLDLPRTWLPHAAAEGDHLSVELTGDGCVRFEVDAVATRRARQAYQAQLDALNASGTGGDVDL